MANLVIIRLPASVNIGAFEIISDFNLFIIDDTKLVKEFCLEVIPFFIAVTMLVPTLDNCDELSLKFLAKSPILALLNELIAALNELTPLVSIPTMLLISLTSFDIDVTELDTYKGSTSLMVS